MPTRDEVTIAFAVDQQQLDNVMQSMPTKFASAAKKSASAFETEFRNLAKGIGHHITEGLSAFSGALIGASIGRNIVGKVEGAFESINRQIDAIAERAKNAIRGNLRTDLSPQQFQAGDQVFTKAVGEGSFEKALDKTGEAVAKVNAGGEGADKIALMLAELGASMESIEKGDYKKVFYEIAENMKTAIS